MAAPSYFKQQRQNYIEEMLDVVGFVQPAHLMNKFGISDTQASIDIADYSAEHAGEIVYNASTKHYTRVAKS